MEIVEVYLSRYHIKKKILTKVSINNEITPFVHDNILQKILVSPDKDYILYTKIRKIFTSYPNISTYLIKRYSDSNCMYETLIRMKYNIQELRKCQCGNPLHIISNDGPNIEWQKYCSTYCAGYYTVEKVQNTKLKRHGDKGYSNLEKRKATNLKRYGNTCYLNIPKLKQNQKEKWEENRKKKIQQLKEIYGDEKVLSLLGDINILPNNFHPHVYSEQQKKRLATLKKHHTFNTSKPEEELYKILCDIYGNDNVKRQFKSKLYPWSCDFYIKSINTYIELQGYYTHGKHPFDENSEKDLERLKKLKTTNLDYYIKNNTWPQIISIWVMEDVLKRNKAKDNNLNYIEIFNYKDLENVKSKLLEYHGQYMVI